MGVSGGAVAPVIAAGDVVIIPFPFSDLSATKRRPALVLATLPGDDVVLCAITTRTTIGPFDIPITTRDFAEGSLRSDSSIRPEKLFTADRGIAHHIGKLNVTVFEQAVQAVITILRAGITPKP